MLRFLSTLSDGDVEARYVKTLLGLKSAADSSRIVVEDAAKKIVSGSAPDIGDLFVGRGGYFFEGNAFCCAEAEVTGGFAGGLLLPKATGD